jgi:ABC-2 type transport system permease protein
MNWDQFGAILWLRWRLTKNALTRGGQVNAVLSILLAVLMGVAAFAAGVGGIAFGWINGSRVSAPALLLIWDGILFAFFIFWALGLAVEIQRSETIDMTRLLHLPLSLQQVFVFNYLASHLTPSLAIFLPLMLGFSVGLTFGTGSVMALMIPVVLGLIFLVTAWTYCLRGWLAALMINKRKRRAIIVWITMIMILGGQLPNLVFNSRFFRHSNRGVARQLENSNGGLVLSEPVLTAHWVLPPGWVGYSAKALKEHQFWPALGAAAAGGLLGALGLMRAYRMTLRFYRGADQPERSRTALASPVPTEPAAGSAASLSRRPLLVERRLPGLPDDTAALTLATFRSLLRAPELKMALIMPVVMSGVFGSLWFSHAKPAAAPGQFIASFAGTLVVIVSMFSVSQMLSNVFGLDRSGFRALMLLPTRRHHILLAKNLAFLPLAAAIALALLILVRILVGLPWLQLAASLVQVPAAFLMFCLCGNLLAIFAPYRMAAGSLQAKKPKAIVFVAAFASMLLLPIVLAPILIPPGLQWLFAFQGWAPWLPINLLASLTLLAVVIWLYTLLLPLEGRLLYRREQAILKEVTEETE